MTCACEFPSRDTVTFITLRRAVPQGHPAGRTDGAETLLGLRAHVLGHREQQVVADMERGVFVRDEDSASTVNQREGRIGLTRHAIRAGLIEPLPMSSSEGAPCLAARSD